LALDPEIQFTQLCHEMTKLEPLKSGYYVWHYVPSIAAAIIFAIIFAAVTIYHFWKLFKTKVRFTIPFAIGGLCKSISRQSICQAYMLIYPDYYS
jgi:hypothetical protein